MANKGIKELQKSRAKTELKLTLLKVINGYKSKEEPHITLSNIDVVNVLSSIISTKSE
jgi:hypothetical protein